MQLLTFPELLARVLLEQSFVGNWFLKIMCQELEDRLNLLFSVSGEFRQCRVLLSVRNPYEEKEGQ